MTLHSSSGERENQNRVRWSRVRQRRREEMNSLPHVLWMLAEKVRPRRNGVVCISPANRRKRRASFPCRIRHRKLLTPLAMWRFTPLVPPRHPAPHRAFGVRSSHAARAAQTVLPPAHPQVSRQPSRTQVVTPPAYAAQEDAVAIRFPSPVGSGGSGNRLRFCSSLNMCRTHCKDGTYENSRLALKTKFTISVDGQPSLRLLCEPYSQCEQHTRRPI